MSLLDKRASGILMHISSLPDDFGIGTFGSNAYRFVDFLVRAGQTYWQILPICPDSFASNTYLLISDGHALAVDPSVSIRAIIDGAKEHNATVEGILFKVFLHSPEIHIL